MAGTRKTRRSKARSGFLFLSPNKGTATSDFKQGRDQILYIHLDVFE
jgi:hypothetical protein